MTWNGHWHGFGPWVGPSSEYAREDRRRPGRDPNDDQTRMFLTNTMTPVQTGHALLRRSQASADRTWTDVEDALLWIGSVWNANPPGGDVLPLNQHLAYDRGHLSRGSDCALGYYNSAFHFVSYSVICCPNHFFPHLPCPLPPR
ncbi:hypothetical protein [Micromonospora yangpuensis]|uniref:Uncharacterized protein n=1 Tax=Micromonospora yangpuensis TaxID=683228 RepID=A0A1C6U9E0_9ACTN|nr:hypothetical protein [Micromonospora yangpuensis]GGL88506.1 hypothetical protein GCM10012279_02730 [Micromonospora yangpuensis]SCL50636.1 hypothetical protein GA0070617_1544 [Micromonospora yangpuensis]